MRDASSVVGLLQARAADSPDRVAYTFLSDGEAEASQLTFAGLDERARAIGAELQKAGGAGGRALLLFPPGLEFVTAFLGCLYAGTVAVPAYPPHKKRGLKRLSSIAADAEPALVLTTSALAPAIQMWAAQTPHHKKIQVLSADLVPVGEAQSWRDPGVGRDTLAFLQYTSGSTGSPKGVMVTHGNIVSNEEMIHSAFEQSESSIIVSWLPLYHDMGLIGGVLQPLYVRASCVLMSSLSFLQRPRRWLEVITEYRATTSGGPNFAYDLCVRKIPAAQREGLDLSSWKVAFNGAEPIRAETLERFAQAFGPHGFHRRAFYPCYGLAEATLFVTGDDVDAEPRLASVSSEALQENRVVESVEADRRTLVACGRARMEQQVLIVDTETRKPCLPARVGEIWVAGASVARGYWNRPQETKRDFDARLSVEGSVEGQDEVSYLRTGDLGFINDGQLFITGRLKDLIIVRGRNFYPQDIEYTVESCHPSLRPGCGAAFSITVEDEERAAVVQEVDRRFADSDAEAIVEAIRAAVAQEHELLLHDVVLIRTGSIPKTSSGKIQRHACREGYLAGSLDAVARNVSEPTRIKEELTDGAAVRRADLILLDAVERRQLIEEFLKSQSARILRLSRSRLDARQTLLSVGLDSLAAVELKHTVEERLGVSISLSALLDGASIAQIAREILQELERTASVPNRPLPSAEPLRESPLTYGQRGLWFVQRLAPGSGAYHIPVVIRITGHLDAQALQRAFQAIVERHPALRTTFEQTPDGEPLQRIHDSLNVNFTSEDAASWDEETLTRRCEHEAWRPFDLSRETLLRVALFRRTDSEHVLVLTVHHLVADLRSLVVVFDELTKLYLENTAHVAAELKPLPARYTDYAAWEQTLLNEARGERLWNYWQASLAAPLATLDLPTDRPRPPIQTYRGASRALNLDARLTGQLQDLARSSGASLFVVLLTAFKVMLHRYTGQTDILVGCPVAGRNVPEVDDLVGYFVNPLALRTDASGDPGFRELMERVRRTTLGALEHREYPFALLAERLNLVRDPSRTPVFQVMFALQKAQLSTWESLSSFALGESGAEIQFGDLTFHSLGLAERQVPFDLMLMLAEGETDLRASLQYNRDLFDDETAERMLEQFRALLDAVVAHPDQSIGSVNLLTPSERQHLLVEWNSTGAEFERDSLIHELFEAQAERTPGAVAIVSEDETLSYSELDSRANRLAQHLRRAGVAPGTVVGINVERSVNLAVAILGILKAGGAYLPLDPSHPQERLKLILENAHVPLVITSERLRASLSGFDATLLLLDAEWADISKESDERLPRLAAPEQSAYLLYTSGSTGRPKGVAVPHRAVVNFLTSMARQPGLTAEDVFVSVTTPSFDIFGLELYLPLMKGARLILPSQETTADGAKLLRTLNERRATAMQATPATWRLLLAAGWQGAPGFKALCGGEALDVDLAKELFTRASPVWNLYGPTETTIWSAVYEVSDEDERGGYIPIGRPIANTSLYVLDANLELVPTGAAGELFIGGDGLAQGYWELPALTAEKFVPDHLGGKPGARLYRTGDLARWRPDGILEFFGRLDNQVKVRGFRIELGEVEAALASCAGVLQAVVVAWKDDSGDQRLVGYIVPADPQRAPDTAQLRNSLLERLPEPFVPSLFVPLESLPLTPNGKIDRKALPKPESRRQSQAVEYVAPRSEVERLIVETWKQTLGVEKAGLNDNFFDLGGHSLLLAQVQSRLSKSGYEVSMLDLLRHPTISALATRLGQEQTDSPAVVQGARRGADRRSSTSTTQREIAIIGMAGRFPKAGNIEEFWQRLSRGDECISFFTDEELAESGIAPGVLSDPDYVKAGGVLEGADLFDAAFFGFHPREAELMDPQHRAFLECAWHALEDAGYDSARYGGHIGVFGGAGLNTYLYEVSPTLSNSSALRYQAFIGNDKDFVTTRVSYKLNLKGPSVNVQSACSTSLVAVHLACQSLLAGECDMALAGGVAIRAPHKQGYFYEEGGILSPDAHCRAFDKDAQGTVFGSGVGIVVLKPLASALADGDHVYAVIKGSAINNDGGLKLGYTAPSVDGQAEVISEALTVSGIEPETITYVETHGTGTPLGDPIEVAALQEAFRGRGAKKQFCAIGSVKTNIGHLDTAAGITGLIKTVCALRHGLLPPSLNFKEPNPKIDFANSPFYVNTQLAEWRANGTPRRAGVSSFGIGGTNAHVILEEAPPAASSGASRPWRLLMLSAKTSGALEKATQNLAEKLKGDDALDLADVSYTTQIGRQVFTHRRVALCTDSADAVSVLESQEPTRLLNGSGDGAPQPVAFLFPGQGTQYVNMARELYESEPVFASEVEACAELLKPELDLRALLFPSEAQAEEAARQLERTAFAQPALFVVEYALARLWMSWGVKPAAMLGHSIGEYVAACLAGVFSLEDALSLVVARGRLMQTLPGGAMLAVQLSEEELRPRLAEELSLAAVNAPSACVVSGTVEAISVLEAALSKQEIVHTRLHTSHAFHSPMMEPILEEFAALVSRCKLNPPTLPYISNLTGVWIEESQATDALYWSRHLRETVLFGAGVETLLKEPGRVLLEVGPGRALSTLARRQDRQAAAISSLPHARDKQSDVESLLGALGRLWIAEVEIDWQGFYAHEQRRRVSLPNYPFEGQRHWIKSDAKTNRVDKSDPSEWFYVPAWRRTMLPFSSAQADASSVWLLLETEELFSAKLAEHLRSRGVEFVTARLGDRFARLSDDGYILNPRRREDYDALLQDLHARGRFPQNIVHAWNVTTNRREDVQSELWEDARCRSFDSLMFMAQALERVNPGGDVRIGVVSNNMQKVCGERMLQPEKSLLLGPLKVIPQEYPNLRCQSIDVSLADADGVEGRALCQDLFEELTAPLQDRVVAYRGGERWVQTFEPWHADESAKLAPRLHEGGVYLITGGLGGVGLTLAEEIARTVKARLILTGRAALPERERWPEWIETHGEQDRASMAMRKIKLLEELGSEVVTFAADVSDEQAMSKVVGFAREKFGDIRGVVHAAGIAGGGIIQLKTTESAGRVLEPKTRGTLVLHAALQGSELDFFLICSSTNAIIGGFGQSDYCAANAFCDAFAQAHFSHRGAYVVSVNWDRWNEVGMAVRSGETFGELSLPRPVSSNGNDAAHAHMHPLLGSPLVETSERVVFTSQFSPASHWVLSEHLVAGLPTVPGTTYLEMARAAFAQLSHVRPVEIREVTFSLPLVVGEGTAREVVTLLDRNGGGYSFRILSRAEASADGVPPWDEHARGKIGVEAASQNGVRKNSDAVNRILERGQKLSDDAHRKGAGADAQEFITTGPRWHSLKEAYVSGNEALAVLEIDERFADDLAQYELHPSLLDISTGFIQFLVAGDYLPLVYERLTIHSPIPKKVFSHVKFRGEAREQREIITCDVSILDADGMEVVSIDGFSMKRVSAGALQSLDAGGLKSPDEGALQSLDANGHTSKSHAKPAPESVAIRALSEGISPRKGAEVFRRILSGGTVPQLIVSTRDIHELIHAADSLTRDRLLEEYESAGAKETTHARPAVSSAYTEPSSEVERRIVSVWQRVLGVEQVGAHDNFFELGGTSLNGIQMVSELKKEFKVDIPVVSIFEATTVAALAKYLNRNEEGEAVFDQIQDRAERKKKALGAQRRPPNRRES
jgi:amino acid adenylation domain-containing protein